MSARSGQLWESIRRGQEQERGASLAWTLLVLCFLLATSFLDWGWHGNLWMTGSQVAMVIGIFYGSWRLMRKLRNHREKSRAR